MKAKHGALVMRKATNEDIDYKCGYYEDEGYK